MRKFLITLAVGLLTTLPAQALTSWSCNYTGSWKNSQTGGSGNFNWLVYWISISNGNWRLVGYYNDQYGHAWLDGNCTSGKTCGLYQRYTTGKLVGKPYFYQGSYTDQSIDSTHSNNTIQGSWGPGPKQLNQGSWRAQAPCSRNPANFDLRRALGSDSARIDWNFLH